MEIVLKATENFGREDEIRFEVFVDEPDLQAVVLNDGSTFDFGDGAENQEYSQRFIRGELCSYGVSRLKVCKCCCCWSEIDSLWGIHAESPENALEIYKQEGG